MQLQAQIFLHGSTVETAIHPDFRCVEIKGEPGIAASIFVQEDTIAEALKLGAELIAAATAVEERVLRQKALSSAV